MITQSNPVVFVTLGQCSGLWPMLSSSLKGYLDIVGYIAAPDRFDDDFIKNEVGRIWREFLRRDPSLADVIRVNFVMRADKAGTGLPALRESIEWYFQKLYPAGMMTDVYCLLDDANLLSDGGRRRDVLNMLAHEQSHGLVVYLLSNLTSMNQFITDENICHTITLLSLFKDCVPDLYVAGADASRYNEFFFLENCAMRHGVFLTAGSLVLSVPRDALKALYMAELLAFGMDKPLETEPGEGEVTLLSAPPEVLRKPTKSMDYLFGMAIPEVSRGEAFTREQWLNRLFGQRLEQLVEQSKQTSEESSVENFDFSVLGEIKANIFDLLRQTGKGGFYEQVVKQIVSDANYDLRRAEDAFLEWIESVPAMKKGTPETATRRLSPFIVQHIWPYILASEYLRKQMKLQHLANKIASLEGHSQLVAKVHQALLGYMDNLHTVIQSYNEKAETLNDAFAAFTPRAVDYFRQSFKEYAASHHDELVKLSKGMTAFLYRGDISKYLERLEGYIDNNILPSQTKPVMDILYELTDGKFAAEALGEWVLQSRHMNMRLKTGTTGIYMEANLFMPDAHGDVSAADVKKQYEGRALGRMNLFAKTDADRVAVLYHAGSFNAEDLYYGYFGE